MLVIASLLTTNESEQANCFGVFVAPELVLLQADFFVDGENSITLPRSCGGSHFTRFENLVGM